MIYNKIKNVISVAVSLSLITNFSPPINAADLVAIPQNKTSVIIPPNSSIVQSRSTEFSMKSIETKISNVFKPKKEVANKVNRKLLDIYSGSCGTSVRWSLDTITKELTISGSGAMSDFATQSNAPWYDYRTLVQSVTISEGVTSIGKYAFYDYDSLNSISIPSSVKTIGSYAFYDCDSIETITIPEGVKTIGSYAFYGCSRLTGELTIPSSVTSINSYAFYACNGLTSVTIAASSIGSHAFFACKGLTSLTISYGVKTIGEYAFESCNKITGALTIPSSVTSIGYRAFIWCSSLTSVTIPSSVTSIGGYAFYQCYMTSLTISEGVTKIGDCAFYGCTGLTSVTIPNSVTSIGSSAFYGCSRLTSLMIQGSNTSIASSAFRGCSSLTSLTISEGVTKIGDSAFYGCTGLTSVTIPNSVTSIGSNAFGACSKLTSIIVYENNNYKSVDGILYSNNGTNLIQCPAGKSGEVTIPASVTDIDDSAFASCTKLTSINVDTNNNSYKSDGGILYSGDGKRLILCPKGKTGAISISQGVTSIENYAFYDNDSLTGTLNIPEGVTKIGNYAFYRCNELTSLTIPSSVTSIGGSAFSGCSGLNSLTISEGGTSIKTSIGTYAFSGCSGLTGALTIPSSVTSIGSYAFYNCYRLTSLNISKGAINGSTSISDHAFYNCSGLTGALTIPSSVNYIGWAAFYGCSRLNSLTVQNGVTNIHESAFSGCSGLTGELTIPSSVTSIAGGAFSGCSGLTSLIIQNGVTNISDSVFSGCSGLTSITIGSGLKTIGNNAFKGCFDLTSINVDENNQNYKSIDGILYSKDGKNLILCPASKTGEVSIPQGVTLIKDYAFLNCSSLTSVGIPFSATSIGDYAFHNCSSLNSVNFTGLANPNPKREIFTGCSNLSSVDVPATYGDEKFFEKDVKKTLSPISLGKCGDSATWELNTETGSLTIKGSGDMYDYSPSSSAWASLGNSIKTVTISGNVASIGDYFFYGCNNLTSVTISSNITSIGDSAFEGCTSLTTITIPSSVTSIGEYAFRECTAMTSIDVDSNNSKYQSINGILYSKDDKKLIVCPVGKTDLFSINSGTASIESYAFHKCKNLTSVTIPDSMTSIGDSAFSDCSGLTSVVYDGTSAPQHGTNIFNGCSKLMEVKVPNNYSGDDFCDKPFYCTGICGTNAKWEFHSNNSTLTINGPGAMTNYDSASVVPWNTQKSKIKTVVIESITNIGSYAFESCTGLTNVTIPSSVTSIGYSAFEGCDGLTSVTIPSSVTSIGDYAFRACSGLTSIDVEANNNNYKSIDGILYSKYGTNLIQYPGGKTGTVTIPSSVASIESYAFYGCSGLTSVTIPEGVNSIGQQAFKECSSLTSVTYTGTIEPNHGTDVFTGCEQLDFVNVPSYYANNTFCDIPVIKKPTSRFSSKNKPKSFKFKKILAILPFIQQGEKR